MASPPFMQLFVALWTSEVQHLTCEQDGAYFRLIRAMWTAGGALPNVHRKLATICGLSEDRWAEIGPDVLEFFQRRGGTLTHKKVSEQLAVASAKKSSRMRAGKLGGLAKARKNKEKAVANATVLLKHLKDIRKKEPLPLNGAGSDELFELEDLPPEKPVRSLAQIATEIHAHQPRKFRRSAKADIEAALTAAVNRGKDPELITLAIGEYYGREDSRRDDGRWTKAAHRMIQGDRWEDHVPEPAAAPIELRPEDVGLDVPWRRRALAWRVNPDNWQRDWGPKPTDPKFDPPPGYDFGLDQKPLH